MTINMALLKYLKVEKCGLPLPDPCGSLNQQLSSTAIEEANKEVTAVLFADPAKRHLNKRPILQDMLLITELLMPLDSF